MQKIKNVFDLIPQLKPQIVGLLEVENSEVVKKLGHTLGYKKSIVTNSPDERGIDVALIFNESDELKFISSRSIRLSLAEIGKPTRDILEAKFKILTSAGPQYLMIYVNHWPSQAAPASVRIAVANKLAQEINAQKKNGHHVLVMGDFNVIDTDSPNPFEALSKIGLHDVEQLFRKVAKNMNIDLSKMPVGSYYFGRPGNEKYPPDNKWNQLDKFFVSQSLLSQNSSVKADLLSYRIFSPPQIVTDYVFRTGSLKGTVIKNVPQKYTHFTDDAIESGFSDHFPILIDVKLSK